MHTGKKRDPSDVLDAREGNMLDVGDDARWAELDAATEEGTARTHLTPVPTPHLPRARP
jgi:hypothetical protein